MNNEQISAGAMLRMLRDQIFLSTDTEESDDLCKTFKSIFMQIEYLERCHKADSGKN